VIVESLTSMSRILSQLHEIRPRRVLHIGCWEWRSRLGDMRRLSHGKITGPPPCSGNGSAIETAERRFGSNL
jgi:hypothetical protein